MPSLPEYRSKHTHALWAVLSAAAILLLTHCGGKKEKEQAAETNQPVSVVVKPVVQKTVPIYTELTARTDATASVEIRARVKAYLKTQNYKEGTLVKKGKVLFTLDPREYQAQLQQARAQLDKANADLQQAQQKTVVQTAEANVAIAEAALNKANTDVNRLKPLAEKRAVPQQDYDNALAAQQAAKADLEGKQSSLNTAKVNQTAQIELAQAAVAAAKAQIVEAQLNVEYCTIRSPIDGIAGLRQVAPGNLVGSTDATLLTTVSDVNPLRVYISIAEADYLQYSRLRTQGKLKPGATPLELILADGSVFPQKGRLIIADRAVDLKTGTLNLVAQFPNPTEMLRPGQFGRVRFAATVAQNALLVPQKAVTELLAAKTVFIVSKENKVELRSVTLGDRVGEDYIVTAGLKPGERIIVEGIQKVRPGVTVNPTTQPAAPEKGYATRMQ
jgi:membrane fusion protein (multidrug efflux system)